MQVSDMHRAACAKGMLYFRQSVTNPRFTLRAFQAQPRLRCVRTLNRDRTVGQQLRQVGETHLRFYPLRSQVLEMVVRVRRHGPVLAEVG